MDEQERRSELMSALTTEHFVLQTGANAATSEIGARASLYLVALSSSLVAMGFAAQSGEVFVPFVATILPSLFLLGVFTVVRLIDAAMEYNQFLAGIARIRGYYRTLSPEAAEYFAPELGRWPETEEPPSLRLGEFIAFVTTTASMVAFINSIVAGAGIALLTHVLRPDSQTSLAVGLGIAGVVVLMAAFYCYQRWRYSSG